MASFKKRDEVKSFVDVDILILGKTGTGKSALGNSILLRNAFKSSCSMDACTQKMQHEVTAYKNTIIKVVDGPGLLDAGQKKSDGLISFMSIMSKAITANPRGYHALLLTIKYGNRYSHEDLETLQYLKTIFGESFVRKFCILVLTCGDIFDDEENGDFKKWCSEQTGEFKNLIDECNGRVLLFYNKTKSKAKKHKQLTELIQMILELSKQNGRYTDKHFEKARENRERFEVSLLEPVLREETLVETSLILQKLEEVKKMEPLDRVDPLKMLKRRLKELYKSIKVKDRSTGALHRLKSHIQSVLYSIKTEITVAERVQEDREQRLMTEKERTAELEKNVNLFAKLYIDTKNEYDRYIENDLDDNYFD